MGPHKDRSVMLRTLFIMPQARKQLKCPSTDKQINKMWYNHTMEYYSAVKRNEVLVHVTTWISFKNMLSGGRPSRWCRSKTWRSPSSPQIHQKYIYMWNNSYRTTTERWQKTSDFPKGKKLPTYLGRAKEKKKKQRQKNRDGTCTSGRELWRRKSFHSLGSPFTGGDGSWRGGSFGATEESAATGVQRAKRRDSRTEDWCWPALTSLRGLSAHLQGRAGAGSWGFGFRVQIPGRGLGLAVWTQPEGG